jgi:hypothetical protein
LAADPSRIAVTGASGFEAVQIDSEHTPRPMMPGHADEREVSCTTLADDHALYLVFEER